MALLEVGDVVLTAGVDGGLEVTRVVANQHQRVDQEAELLVLHLSSGAVLRLTPDHALYIDGALVAASEAKVGSALVGTADKPAAVIRHIERTNGAVINPVTVAGTLLASDDGPPVLAASHPVWIASLLVRSASARTLANAVLWLAGSEGLRAVGGALERFAGSFS
jgi:hypothetical protein